MHQRWCTAKLAASRKVLTSAQALVPEREAHYGLSDAANGRQVWGWRPPNPTTYNFGYLWPVHRLFYWERDQAIVENSVENPCFGTINDPVELGLRGGGSDFVH